MSEFDPLDPVDVFTTGAVGQPGSRVFFLQLRSGDAQFTMKCEKQQVAAMVDHLRHVLEDLPPPEDRPLVGALELLPPSSAEFVLGPIGLGYDPRADMVVLQFEEVHEVDDEGDPVDDDHERIRVQVTRGQAAAFCDHADGVVASGRPNCRWCDQPIDPDGHPCPRMN